MNYQQYKYKSNTHIAFPFPDKPIEQPNFVLPSKKSLGQTRSLYRICVLKYTLSAESTITANMRLI